MKRRFGAHLWVGLDLGSYSVKLYAASPRGLAPSQLLMAEVAIPGVGANGRAPDEEAVTAALGECLGKAGVSLGSIRGLITGVSGPDVVVKQVQLPLLDDEEVGPALRFEARKHLPFDPQGMVLDYQIVARYPSEKRMEVLLAAVSEARLDRHLGPLRKLDLEPDIVDATPLALTNATLSGARFPGAVLLDLGHEASTLSICARGEPYFSRRIGFGGRSITLAISEAARIPFDEAEEWKVASGGPRATHVLDWKAVEMQAVQEALRRELVEELRRSFLFYQTQGKLPEPMALQLCGGGAQLPMIAERLADLLDMEVELFQPPVPGAALGGRQAGPQYAQAYGLSLRMR